MGSLHWAGRRGPSQGTPDSQGRREVPTFGLLRGHLQILVEHMSPQVVLGSGLGTRMRNAGLGGGPCLLPCSTPPPAACSHSPRLLGLLEAEMKELSLLEAPYNLLPVPGGQLREVLVPLTFPSTQLINTRVSRHCASQAGLGRSALSSHLNLSAMPTGRCSYHCCLQMRNQM